MLYVTFCSPISTMVSIVLSSTALLITAVSIRPFILHSRNFAPAVTCDKNRSVVYKLLPVTMRISLIISHDFPEGSISFMYISISLIRDIHVQEFVGWGNISHLLYLNSMFLTLQWSETLESFFWFPSPFVWDSTLTKYCISNCRVKN